MIKKEKASVTIFFVYTIVLVMSLIFSVTEMARMNAERLYLQMASSVSVESMMSLYHRKLYEYYHIFALEMRDDERLKTEYLDFLMPHFRENILGEERKINNWEIAYIDKDNVNLNYKNIITDNNIEKEIIEYMKISLIGRAIEYLGDEKEIKDENDLDSLKEVYEELIKSHDRKILYSKIHKRYFDFSSSLKKIAKNADEIKKDIKEVNNFFKSNRSISSNGTYESIRKVKNEIDKIKNKIDNISKSINGYKEALKTYREKIDESIERYEDDLQSNKYDFDNEAINFIEEEFETFISFSDKEDEVLKKIEELESHINIDKNEFSKFKNELDVYVNEISFLEDYKKELSKLKGEERDQDSIDTVNEELKSLREEIRDYVKEIIKPYIADIEYEEIEFYIVPSDTDEEKKLEKIISFAEGGVLKMILTDDEYEAINTENVNYKSFNINKNSNLINKVLVNEYRLYDFNYYNKWLSSETTKSGSNALEVERIIKGKNSDIENLDLIVKEIITIRMAINILYIYTKPELRERARNLSIATFGAISPILQEMMFILIITSWGTCQSIKDAKKLLHGKRVPFIPNDESFDFDVMNIFEFGGGDVSVLDDDNDSGKGLLNMNYKDYLRLLMLKEDGIKMNKNMVSIIQRNMEKEEDSFSLDNMLYSFGASNTFKSTHMLTDMIFLRPKNIVLDDSYKIKINAYSDYGNLKK